MKIKIKVILSLFSMGLMNGIVWHDNLPAYCHNTKSTDDETILGNTYDFHELIADFDNKINQIIRKLDALEIKKLQEKDKEKLKQIQKEIDELCIRKRETEKEKFESAYSFLKDKEIDQKWQFGAKYNLRVKSCSDLIPLLTKGVFTPLTWAVAWGCADIIKLLIERGANINAQIPSIRFNFDKNATVHGSPLHIAASNGDAATFQLLLKYGANLAAIDDFGDSPVHLALQTDTRELIKYLLKRATITYTVMENDAGYEAVECPISPTAKEMIMSKLKKDHKKLVSHLSETLQGLNENLIKVIVNYCSESGLLQ